MDRIYGQCCQFLATIANLSGLELAILEQSFVFDTVGYYSSQVAP